MMYNNKLVTCLKSNGKILREFKDAVYVPFGSEYSILVKNLNSVRAIVNITIDGKEVCPGGLVVNANSETEIERFVKDGNLSAGNRFKFIERTESIEKHRGIKTDDGLIRVSFKFERIPAYAPLLWPNGHWEWKHEPPPFAPYYPPYHPPYWYTTKTTTTTTNNDITYTGLTRGITGQAMGGTSYSANTCNTMSDAGAGAEGTLGSIGTAQAMNCSHVTGAAAGAIRDAAFAEKIEASGQSQAFVNDVGITVPGSVSNQKFVTVNDFPTESEEHVMVIRILGETSQGHFVKTPITVKAKPKCTTCGRHNKATAHFCVNCGTALEIV